MRSGYAAVSLSVLCLLACSSEGGGGKQNNKTIGASPERVAGPTAETHGVIGEPLGSIQHRAAPLGIARVAYAPGELSPTQWVVATDPDTDSVWLTNAGAPPLRIPLPVGEEPGDIAVGWRDQTASPDGVIYVSLHHGGAILSIPMATLPESGPVPYKRLSVCGQPRGMDVFQSEADYASTLIVACADGALVMVDSQSDTVTGTFLVPDDAKDVVVVGYKTALVTLFRTAQILQVDIDPVNLTTPPTAPPTTTQSLPRTADRLADVAWQMIPFGTTFPKSAIIVHQLASAEPIVVPTAGASADGGVEFPPLEGPVDAGFFDFDGGPEGVPFPPEGADAGPPFPIDPPCDGPDCGPDCNGIDCQPTCDPNGCQQSGYGPSNCQVQCGGCPVGVVAAAATVAQWDGMTLTLIPAGMFQSLVPPLTVAMVGGLDVAGEVEVVGLGNNLAAVLPSFDPSASQQSDFACVAPVDLTPRPVDTLAAIGSTPVAGSTAFFTLPPEGTAPQIGGSSGAVTLPMLPISNREGRDLFHQATPSGMSCASCHPFGREDSHIWNFIPMGLRRTPALGGGLLATAPFHWDGAEASIGQLMNDVFVNRMQGTPPDPSQVTAISEWLNGVPVAHDHAPPDPDAVARGRALFQSPGVGCTLCHTGPHFTNNLTLDVGTGGSFQVPSLLGVGAREPFLLHDGSAANLEQRFEPWIGGGDLHGHTSQLTTAQIADLVSYLRSL